MKTTTRQHSSHSNTRNHLKKRHLLIHTPDFSDVRYGSLHWKFTKLKAPIIKRLFEASQSPFPEVHHDQLVQASGAFSELRRLFWQDPSWGTLVVYVGSSRRGYYRLATINELHLLHLQNQQHFQRVSKRKPRQQSRTMQKA